MRQKLDQFDHDLQKMDKRQAEKQVTDHITNKILKVDEVDIQMWEMATNVPRLSKEKAFGCVVLNVLIPGFGTILAACLADDNVSKSQCLIGLL